VNELRRQTPLGSREPHTDLLDVGDSFSAEGWRITVTAAGDADSAVDTAAWTVTVAREDD